MFFNIWVQLNKKTNQCVFITIKRLLLYNNILLLIVQ